MVNISYYEKTYVKTEFELLPCPFCGSEDLDFIKRDNDDFSGYYAQGIIFCKNCDATISYKNKSYGYVKGVEHPIFEVVRRWNNRINLKEDRK